MLLHVYLTLAISLFLIADKFGCSMFKIIELRCSPSKITSHYCLDNWWVIRLLARTDDFVKFKERSINFVIRDAIYSA